MIPVCQISASFTICHVLLLLLMCCSMLLTTVGGEEWWSPSLIHPLSYWLLWTFCFSLDVLSYLVCKFFKDTNNNNCELEDVVESDLVILQAVCDVCYFNRASYMVLRLFGLMQDLHSVGVRPQVYTVSTLYLIPGF